MLKGTPNPKQRQFFMCKTCFSAYGGARGGGKSWAMRRKFVLLALRYNSLELLLLRRTLNELIENHGRPLLRELYSIAKYNSTSRAFLFPNGSRIRLGYCDKEKDVYQYQGQEYDVIGLEEATHFTYEQMQFLSTCNRTSKQGFSPRMYFTCNPGGIGHAWVKRLFIDCDYTKHECAQDYSFIPASVYDNPILLENDPDYVRILENLPEHLRRAHLEGDWNVLFGQFFPEFRVQSHVCEQFLIPTWWKRFRAMDWGYNDPCCVLWFAIGPDGRVFVYKEEYARHVLSSEMAARICKNSINENIAYTVASPDAWQNRGLSHRIADGVVGESIAEVFSKCGAPLLRADPSRIAGWQRVREYLAQREGGPLLQIFPCCKNLIRTLPLLLHDSSNCEDAADGEDHAAEALRYGLMSRPTKSIRANIRPEKLYDPLSEGKNSSAGFMGQ